MNDMSSVIVPKSDQLNSDDLIAGPRTIRIRDVTIRPGTEQPVSIFFDGDNNKPWKPCKSASRVLVAAWGADANAYLGRSATIYRDDGVTWGGMKVGGIRIAALSDIDRPLVMALTEKKGSKKIATINPLKVEPQTDAAAEWANSFITGLESLRTIEAVTADEKNNAKSLAKIEKNRPDLHERIRQAVDARLAFLSPEKRADDDMGEDPFGGDA
jgi:hypothetical protein